MKRPLLASVLLLGTGLLYTGSAPAARPSRGEFPLPAHPDIVGILRVADVSGLDRRVEELLVQLNPHAGTRAAVRKSVAALLRNDHLETLRPGAYLEIILFDPAKGKGLPWAAAFPVTNAQDYIKAMAGQPGMQEEGTRNNITYLRLDAPGGALTLCLGMTTNHVAVFGQDAAAVARARDLYDQAPPGGVLAARREDLLLLVNFAALMRTAATKLVTARRQLVRDLVVDILGEGTSREHTLARILERLLRSLHEFVAQVRGLDLGLKLETGRISCRLGFTPVAGSLLADIMSRARPRRLTLASRFPADCVSFQDALLWPGSWDIPLEAAAAVVAAGVADIVDPAVRRELAGLLETARKAGPRETAGALVDSSPPLRLRLVEWERGELFPILVGQCLRASGDRGHLREFLLRSGVDFRLQRDTDVARIGELRIHSLRLGLGFDRPRTSAALGDLVGAPGEFLFAYRDGIAAVVSGPDLVIPGRAQAARRAAGALLARALEVSGGEAGAAPVAGRETLLSAHPELAPPGKVLAVAGVSPLRYIQHAAWAYARALPPGREQEANRVKRFAAEFGAFSSKGEMATMFLTAKGSEAIMTINLPRESLRELARACLDIGGGSGR